MKPSATCRGGAQWGSPSICTRPVISHDEAAALNVTAMWCRPHGEAISRCKNVKAAPMGLKSDPVEVAAQTEAAPPRRSRQEFLAARKAETQRRREALAARIVYFVLAADHEPVTRREIAQSLGETETTISRAGALVDDGRVWRKAGPHGGWHRVAGEPA
jgi:hypothetical protein